MASASSRQCSYYIELVFLSFFTDNGPHNGKWYYQLNESFHLQYTMQLSLTFFALHQTVLSVTYKQYIVWYFYTKSWNNYQNRRLIVCTVWLKWNISSQERLPVMRSIAWILLCKPWGLFSNLKPLFIPRKTQQHFLFFKKKLKSFKTESLTFSFFSSVPLLFFTFSFTFLSVSF